ncbi:MAG: flagellar filament capping protein FliD [Planctomycetaceae bacterium]|nr:flagellar filament capping protein FliD [Planctomycetaceae bacterium]
MGSLQLGIGLISGMDIHGTVDKLVSLESGVLRNLQKRNEKFLLQQTYVSQLTSLFSTANYMIRNLAKVSVFDRRDVKSSNEGLLGVARNGNPPMGTHTFTPVRTASSHQILSSGVKSATEPLGITGSITARYGRDLETNFELRHLNGGDGFSRGQIRVTDRSGARATIDLRGATTMKDVLEAINNNTDISVRAEIDGDRIRLTDLSGQTDGKLTVQEVAGGSTAASLGLAGILTDEQSVTGTQIVRLGLNLDLTALHDGNGFQSNSFSSDLEITLANGTKATIDFAQYVPATLKKDENGNTVYDANGRAVIDTPAHHKDEITLGDLLRTIMENETLQGKIQVAVSDDGQRLVWKDLTYQQPYEEDDPANPGETITIDPNAAKFGIRALNGTSSLVSLGLVPSLAATGVTSNQDEITGGRIMGSLGSVLLSSLDGGAGIGFTAPGDASELKINVRDLAGNSATLSISTEDAAKVETLDEYVKMINGKLADEGIGLKVQLNSAKTGLEIKDTSNGYGTSIVFEDTVGDLASKMKLTYTSGTDYARRVSQDLNLQVVSHRTLLSDLNGGKGIDALGSIVLVDSRGNRGTVAMSDDLVTVGDLIRAISSNGGASVVAEINPAGDGIRIIDNAGGTGVLTIYEGDSYSTMAADLHFLQPAEQRNIYGSGNIRYVIDGSMTYNLSIAENDSLTTIVEKLNGMGMGIEASIFNDGTSKPYRLMINGGRTGETAKLTLDLSALGLTQEVMSEARDAVVVYGDINAKNSVMLTSHTNIIVNAVPNINIEIKGGSTTPITVSTESSSLEIKTSLKSYVENINKFLEVMLDAIRSDPQNEDYGVLFTDSTARNLYRDLTGMLTERFPNSGGVESLMQLGIRIDPETRLLEFDEETFDALYKDNPNGIREFFIKTTATDYDKDGKPVETQVGFVAKYTEMAERYTAVSGGSLGYKYESLQAKIEAAYDRENFLQARLEAKRLVLYKSFIAMETALAQMQKSMSAIERITTTTNTTT